MRPVLKFIIREWLSIAAMLIGFVPIALAQAISPATPTDNSGKTRKTAFEVVSIRPSSADGIRISIPKDGDEFRVDGMALGWLIETAFYSMPMQSKQRLINAPAWIWNERFKVDAKVDPADLVEWHNFTGRSFALANPMLQAMLQSALIDRCKLEFHLVPGKADGLALAVAMREPNVKILVASKPGDVIPKNAQQIALDGRMVPIMSDDEPVTHFFNTSMGSLALTMSTWGAPVEDQTGLTGKYNFSIERLSTQGDPSVDWNVAPLGLKLKPVKIPIQVVVIDHIERPSDN